MVKQRPVWLTTALVLAPVAVLSLLAGLAVWIGPHAPRLPGPPVDAGPARQAPPSAAHAFPVRPDCPPLTARLPAASGGEVVVLGASIALGMTTSRGTGTAWPHLLQLRLRQEHIALAVVNDSVSGDRLLTDNTGHRCTSALNREGPALALPHVRALILTDVVNDIQQPPHVNDPREIISGIRQFVDRAHAAGVPVVGTTITPYRGLGTYQDIGEYCRAQVNAAIRHDHLFDGVIDFAAALRDPADHTRIRPAFDSGDHLHPDDAGQRAMADAIRLPLPAGASTA